MDKVGKDGVITVEEGKTLKTEDEFVEGMQFDRGYLSPYFVTDPQKMECELEDAYILIYEKKITHEQGPGPGAGEGACSTGKPLLIIAEEVEGEALATLVINKLRGTFKCVRGQGPRLRRPPQGHARGHRHPDRRQGDLRGPGHPARERRARPTSAGPRRSRSTRTTRRSSRAPARRTTSRAASTRSAASSDKSTSDYDKEKLAERIAKLSGGVAKINVGAATESEMKEKKARVEDAMHATRAAVEEGILPGGGVALLRAVAPAEARRA